MAASPVAMVAKGMRSDPLLQTDFTLRHEILVKEGHRLSFEANVLNIWNQRAVEADYEFAIPTNLINPLRAPRFAGDPGTDWGKVMNGYNYINALNGTGAFGGTVPGGSTAVQAPLTLANRYGMPTLFQQARNFRLALRYTF